MAEEGNTPKNSKSAQEKQPSAVEKAISTAGRKWSPDELRLGCFGEHSSSHRLHRR